MGMVFINKNKNQPVRQQKVRYIISTQLHFM